MQIGEQSDRFTWFIRLATFALVVALLHFAQDVLIPIAFAALLAFLLSPVVVRLMRWKLPKTMAIVVTVSIAFAVIGGLGWLVTTQAMSLARELPNYEENLQQKIAELKQPHTPEGVSRMVGMVENLRRELQTDVPDKPVTPQGANETRPVPVEVRPIEPTPWQLAIDIVQPFLRPLGIAGIVIVFVVAMLFQREDLRDRFIRVAGAGQVNVATQAIDDAANRVSRYLGMQLVVNALYGIPIGLGLWAIGIPNALLWALLATLLRFIPFVGPWIAAAFPLALAVAVDPGWTKLLYTGALFIAMELISNNLIEVVLYGASTGISNFALLVAAVFWTWLWGPAGLVLSTPLTVCLLVLGKHVPGMGFMSMLLGSEPVMTPPAQFYQRMLSMESEEMFDVAAKYVEEHSLEEFYEDVFIPALVMSEEDRHRGALPESRQRFIFQASRDLIEELERRDEAHAASSGRAVAVALPARDEADEIVGQMLSHLLRRRGIPAKAMRLATPLDETFAAVDEGHTRALVISALPPSALGSARQMCRRLRLRCPDAKLLVGVWQHRASLGELNDRISATRPDAVAVTLRAAIDELEKLLGAPAGTNTPFAEKVDRPLNLPSPSRP